MLLLVLIVSIPYAMFTDAVGVPQLVAVFGAGLYGLGIALGLFLWEIR